MIPFMVKFMQRKTAGYILAYNKHFDIINFNCINYKCVFDYKTFIK